VADGDSQDVREPASPEPAPETEPQQAEPVAEKPAERQPAFTPEELAEYDGETIRLTLLAESDCSLADAEYEDAKAMASDLKKRAEAKVLSLRDLIKNRQAQRGKRPEQTLLDFAKPEPKWHALTLDALTLTDETKAKLDGIADLEDLYEQVCAPTDATDGPPLGLTLDELTALREQLQTIIDAEAQEAEAMEKARIAATPSELWREYPISRWTRFGITDKDAEKMEAGEVKRETGRRPIVTVGDLSKFSEPTGTGYSRGYADIKGIGEGGATRIGDAETAFWKWWRDGGESEFAAEKGVTCASVAGTDGSVPEAGSQAAPEDPAATFPSYTDPEGQADRDSETGKVQKRKGQRQRAKV
jgi:hypothetical protein